MLEVTGKHSFDACVWCTDIHTIRVQVLRIHAMAPAAGKGGRVQRTKTKAQEQGNHHRTVYLLIICRLISLHMPRCCVSAHCQAATTHCGVASGVADDRRAASERSHERGHARRRLRLPCELLPAGCVRRIRKL